MENVRYTTNDDTAVFINQIKNRNTSRETKINQELIRFHWRDSERRRHYCCISVKHYSELRIYIQYDVTTSYPISSYGF